MSTATCLSFGESLFHTSMPCNLLLTCFNWPLDYSAPFGMRLSITKSNIAFFKKRNVLLLLMIKVALSTILYCLEMNQTFTADY